MNVRHKQRTQIFRTALFILLTIAVILPILGCSASAQAQPAADIAEPATPVTDASHLPTDTTYYISPTGNDSNNGLSENAPWATFAHAHTVLQPGDTLILLDGTYHQQLRAEVSGTAGHPITYKAQHDFQAIIAPTLDTGEPALYVRSQVNGVGLFGYLTFEGLIVRGIGETAAVAFRTLNDDAAENEMTHHIIAKKLGAFGASQERNSSVFDLGNGLRDSLIEDIFVYGKGRITLIAFGNIRVTIRRAVVRYDYWEGDEYKPNDPRVSFTGYNTQDSIFENIIALDAADTPAGHSGDRGAVAAAGNETPAGVSGSARNKYLGMVILNNPGNGLEVDGGSGSPNEDLEFKDIFIWDNSGYGFNVQKNDDGSTISFITSGYHPGSGVRLDPYAYHPITNEVLTNIFSTHNGRGFYYDPAETALFENNTSIASDHGGDIETAYAPDLSTRLLDPTMVAGHERGATLVNRYVDGVLTSTPLWPWPYEDVIKQHLCNIADLNEVHRWDNADPLFVGRPGWCETDKSLTEYLWEYTGAPCPADICTAPSQTYYPLIQISASSSTDVGISWTHDSNYDSHYDVWCHTQPYFTPTGSPCYQDDDSPWSVTDTALGNPATNHFYKVSGHSAASGATISNHVGEFDFALEAGDL